MSASDLTSDVMAQIRGAGVDKHTTLLLGAGASTTSGLPGWDELATRLLVGSRVVARAEEAAVLLTRQDPLIAVEAARAAYGPAWEQKVRVALYDGVAATESSPLQLAAVAHVLGGSRDQTTLATLNFDELLEQALTDETDEEVLQMSASESTDRTRFAVHHLHGIVTPTRTADVVLSLTEFLDLLARPSSWQASFLRSCAQRGAVVIAGTSYRDPDVRQWLHAAMAGAPPEHATLVLLARQGFDVSREQFRELEKALIGQWSAVGMRAVLLHDFSDAAQVIRELRFVDRPDYLSPQERAMQIWDHHSREFDRLQEEYVGLLQHDAEVLRSSLDVERLNVTLWLSDAEGKLVRWAAQDRVHLEKDGLRRVETGHDSPWIAGRALGSDTLLIQDLEDGDLRRWRSVLALPLPAPHPEFPTASTAVLTVGLPLAASRFEGSKMLWAESLAAIGDAWSSRLALAFSDPAPTKLVPTV